MKPAGQLHKKRDWMVETQLKHRGILNPRVLEVFRKVPREDFVPSDLQEEAYEDRPLPIGFGQTISQPYITALMTERLEPSSADRILEIGTGSGYETAILAELAGEVDSVEINASLYQSAKAHLQKIGYKNVFLKHGDGREGWSEKAPFDKIVVAAGSEEIPQALVEQLKENGRIVIPIGPPDQQDLILGGKEKSTLVVKQLIPVRFVPLR